MAERNYKDRTIIHATDRQVYKTCRKKYHYGSIQRLTRMEQADTPSYFTFGSCGHLALADYYSGSKTQEGAIKVFIEAMTKAEQPEHVIESGIAILRHYFYSSRPIEGEVVMVEETKEITYGDITFVFTMDLVVKTGNSYTIYDHKFYAGFPSDLEVTQNDQASIYLWGLRKLGLWPARFVLNVIRKDAPKQPTLLKNGSLSTAKTQLTTAELFRETVQYYGLTESDYEEYLEHLDNRPDPFHQRYNISRSTRELDLLEQELFWEIVGMTDMNDKAFFRNPGRACAGCQFYELCRSEAEGGDSALMRQHYYRVKENTER